MNEMMITFQTRLRTNFKLDKVLDEYARIHNRVERILFAQIAKGRSSASCKNEFLEKYQITARQFNACRSSIDGKISAYKASQELAIANLKRQIESLDKQIEKFSRKPSQEKVLHHKKRRRQMLFDRMASREKDQKNKTIRLCFGSNKLFNAQFHLKKNGFASFEDWKKAWNAKRNSEFFVLGSKDESSGNQTCRARVQPNEKLSFRLRLPQALEIQYGKYIELSDVSFAYGHEKILAALNHPAGKALSYRFKKDQKGWRLFVSVCQEEIESITQEGIGVIGLDLNVDHVACVETDRFGNVISKENFPWISYGKSRNQLKANTGDLCKKIIDKAKNTKKPIVIEKLDFQEKKSSLQENNKKFARLLSSFAYSLFFGFLSARAFKHGIKVHKVNPAYTSIIGRINYTKRYGLSIHLAAALCIARRYLQFSEAPCSPHVIISDGKESHVAFALPARNRTKHVWYFWAQVKKKIPTVLAAHYRAMKNRSLSPSIGSCDRKLPTIIGENPTRESLATLLG